MMGVAKTKAEIQKLFEGFEDRYVLTTPDGRTFAFRSKKTAQKFKGKVVRAKVQRRAFHGIRTGRPAPVVKRGGKWYPPDSTDERARLRRALKDV